MFSQFFINGRSPDFLPSPSPSAVSPAAVQRGYSACIAGVPARAVRMVTCMDGDAAGLAMRRLSSRGADTEARRADRSRGKEAPFDVLLSPSSVTERSIQVHSHSPADEAGFEVVGDVAALAPSTLHPPLSLLALPAELLTLVAEQLDAHCMPQRARTPD